MDKLTQSDLDMVEYFWTKTGVLERWNGWDKKLSLFEKEYPEMVKAWKDYKIAKRILDIVVKNLELKNLK